MSMPSDRRPGAMSCELVSPDGHLHAVVDPAAGADLVSLRLAGVGELLYRCASPSAEGPGAWPGGAPLLWPAVGRTYPRQPTADDVPGALPAAWVVDGEERPMPIHGFARSLPFAMVDPAAKVDAHSVRLRATSNAATRAAYPFDFQLEVKWELTDAAISQTVSVASDQSLRFGVGNHVTFDVGGHDAWAASSFRSSATCWMGIAPFGLIGGEQTCLKAGQAQSLSEPWACNAVLPCGPDGWLELATPRFGARISQRVVAGTDCCRPEDLLFVLWGSSACGFWCPEPWLGRPNGLTTEHGVVEVPARAPFVWSWRAEIGPAL